MHHANLAAIPEKEQRSPSGKFHSFGKNISLALGGIANTGPWGGGHPFDVQLRRVPSGAAICPFHLHLAQWELFVVQRGCGTVRAGPESHAIETGDVFIHPPNEPHQLINTGPSDLEVLIVADNPPLDAFYYPDSKKWGLRPPGKFFRMTEVEYFDGEEPAVADALPYQPSAAPVAPPLAPFAQRKIRIADLPWEPWESPRKKFRAESKELSIALGAKRHTPIGLGGHPFELELGKLAPGASGCPFHRHAAEWELFLILSGSADIRTSDGVRTFEAGAVVLHPPGEAHQITNASDREDLLYYLIADNAPVEWWHYPDSQKWGFRSPRKFFRLAESEYWDGEE